MGGGWKGDLGAGTMDSEADNPEYLQHHGQKVLKWNKRTDESCFLPQERRFEINFQFFLIDFPNPKNSSQHCFRVKNIPFICKYKASKGNSRPSVPDLLHWQHWKGEGPIAGQELDPIGPFITGNPTLAQLKMGTYRDNPPPWWNLS